MNSKDSLPYLFDKYLRKACSPDEVKELMHLLQEEEMQDLLTPQMEKIWHQLKEQQNSYPVNWYQMYDTITGERATKKKWLSAKWSKPGWKVAATITVLIMLGGGMLWYKNIVFSTQKKVATYIPTKDIQPGGNNAILTLSNGQKIALNKVGNGNIAKQFGVQIVADSGLLTYHKAEQTTTQSVRYNKVGS